MSVIDHKAEAELAEIHAAEMYGTGTDTAYWLASAQVHATLYAAEQTSELVKQQRIANLIAYLTVGAQGAFVGVPYVALDESIREGLNLS